MKYFIDIEFLEGTQKRRLFGIFCNDRNKN